MNAEECLKKLEHLNIRYLSILNNAIDERRYLTEKEKSDVKAMFREGKLIRNEIKIIRKKEKDNEMKLQELFEEYCREYNKAIELGLSKSHSKAAAKRYIQSKDPNLRHYGEDLSNKFWGKVGRWHQMEDDALDSEPVEEEPPVSRRRIGNREEIFNKFDDDTVDWATRFRAAAGYVGRIVDPVYIEPFIGHYKARQFSAYIALLRKEGWEFERDEFGWMVTAEPKETVDICEDVSEERASGPEFTVNRELVELIVNEVINRVRSEN